MWYYERDVESEVIIIILLQLILRPVLCPGNKIDTGWDAGRQTVFSLDRAKSPVFSLAKLVLSMLYYLVGA